MPCSTRSVCANCSIHPPFVWCDAPGITSDFLENHDGSRGCIFTLAPGMMQLALAHSLSMLLSFAPTPIRRFMVPWVRNCTLSLVVPWLHSVAPCCPRCLGCVVALGPLARGASTTCVATTRSGCLGKLHRTACSLCLSHLRCTRSLGVPHRLWCSCWQVKFHLVAGCCAPLRRSYLTSEAVLD